MGCGGCGVLGVWGVCVCVCVWGGCSPLVRHVFLGVLSGAYNLRVRAPTCVDKKPRPCHLDHHSTVGDWGQLRGHGGVGGGGG